MSARAGAPVRRRGAAGRPAGRAGGGTAAAVTTAIVLATAPAEEGGPAATLPWEDHTVIRRLLEQLADIGIGDLHVVTRPEWRAEVERALAGLETPAELRTSERPPEDLRVVSELAERARGDVVLAYGDIVTHREALAGLLADPRLVTGMLSTGGRTRGLALRTRSSRGRVVSAQSPYHAVERPNGAFLGVLKVARRDTPALIEAAGRLAGLVEPPLPAGWEAGLGDKEPPWRRSLARAAGLEPDGGFDREDRPELPAEQEAELRRRLTAVPQDVVSLLLVGLVRAGLHVSNSYLRELFWARPLSRGRAAEAAEEILDYDEDRVLLGSAVKGSDAFFTTYFVSPYSKYIARWAAARGWTPNWVTTASMAVGLLAAAAFAAGSRAGLVAGAILLQLAFTLDCVDGQLARYTRQFSKLGAWLDSVFDRSKEYVVYAGLAIGSSRGFGVDVWPLAAAALTLQTVRHTFDFAFAATQHQALAVAPQPPLEQPDDAVEAEQGTQAPLATTPPDARRRDGAGAPSAASSLARAEPDPPAPASPLLRRLVGAVANGGIALSRLAERWPWTFWLKRILVFRIAERFATISLAAAFTTPRTTLIVVLAWGGFAAAYTFAGRLLRSFAR